MIHLETHPLLLIFAAVATSARPVTLQDIEGSVVGDLTIVSRFGRNTVEIEAHFVALLNGSIDGGRLTRAGIDIDGTGRAALVRSGNVGDATSTDVATSPCGISELAWAVALYKTVAIVFVTRHFVRTCGNVLPTSQTGKKTSRIFWTTGLVDINSSTAATSTGDNRSTAATSTGEAASTSTGLDWCFFPLA